MTKIYFDNASTTKVDEKVLKAMQPYFLEKYGNASSQHLMGTESKIVLENSRKKISGKLNCKKDEIIFNSGGTEGNNFVLKGLWNFQIENKTGKNHVVTTKIEHDSILNVCKWLEKQGCKVTYLNVDSEGFINFEDLKKAITDKTFLVSVIHGNNEIGTIQDLEKIGKICREKRIPFHIDACQSFTKVPIDVKKMNLDFITLNSHKVHGPKGVGAIYISENFKDKIVSLFHGGEHEFGLRSGTENVSGIVGFAKAVDLFNKKDFLKMEKFRDKIIERLLDIEGVKLNGAYGKNRLCNNINVSFDVEGEAVGGYLESYGIMTSAGSACRSHTGEPSHVLKAIGLSEKEADNSLRISLSKFTSEKEVDYFLKKIKNIINKLREF